MAAGTTVKLVIPSEVRLIDLVHATAEKVAEFAGLGEEAALDMALAVREAVINAMCHGNRQDPKLRVTVTLTTQERWLRATVCDQGAGFDPAAAPDPTEGDNRLRSSGRGLLLMRAFVDRVRFRSRPAGGTEVTLIKHLPPSGQAEGARRDSR